MRYKIFIKPLARRDLDDIWSFIAKDSFIAADKFIDKITDKFNLLCDNPNLGVQKDSIYAGARMLITGKYLTLYCINEDVIDIIRVIHGNRDLSNL
jgi:toxin ParE1/3/4